MVVIALTQQVSNDAELTALTGMNEQTIVWHLGSVTAYRYEPHYGNGDITSVEGGYWIKDSNNKGLNLAEYKAYRNEEIDVRTKELIALGYSYAGYTFPLSIEGQINLVGMITFKDALSYPVDLNNINDTAVYNIADSTDLLQLYGTALATKKARLDSGTALKTQVNAAIDEAEVAAIIDNR
jgi:hypothetical protein